MDKLLYGGVLAALPLLFGSAAVAFDDGVRYQQRYQAAAIADGDYETAVDKLQARLERHPDDTFAMLNLASTYERMGRTDEARGLYRRVMEQRENPYAKIAGRQVEPVKSIAGSALGKLDRER